MTKMKLLSPEELQHLLDHHPQWSLIGGMLVREWIFKDFTVAMAFVQTVADLAERANHHPDIDIRYNRVRLALISHDAQGLTSRDRALIQQIEQSQNP